MLIALPDPRPPAVPIAALLGPVSAPTQPALPLAERRPPPEPERVAPEELREVALRCRVLLEAMAGRRPLAHVEQCADLDVLRRIAQQARRRRRLSVQALRASAPRAGVLEVALRVTDQASAREAAIALRLERRSGILVCTALDLGPPQGDGLTAVA